MNEIMHKSFFFSNLDNLKEIYLAYDLFSPSNEGMKNMGK